MINLDISNLTKISPEHGLSETEIAEKNSLIAEYLEKIHARNQGFYTVIDDNSMVEKINNYANEVKGKYDHIVVLGIGGSALGTICLQQSLTHQFKQTSPSLHVIDNIDPVLIKELEDVIELEKTLFIVVTKSGTTPEILSMYYYFRQKVGKENFAFITDPKKGKLREIAQQDNIPVFDIPENVGGRFSVLTAVGLLPAKLIGLDIEALLKGAQTMRDQFLSESADENLPFKIATIQHALSKKNKSITVMMPYAQKLIRFSDWYKQLLAESIGKRLDNQGNDVFVGLTPTSALGVTDQHSQSQLYNEGPNDKLIIFVEDTSTTTDMIIPEIYEGVTFKKLLSVELDATAGSLTKNDRPNIKIQVDSVSEESLGQLFMLFEGATAFLGEFFNINAFDQPGVELSKDLTREALK